MNEKLVMEGRDLSPDGTPLKDEAFHRIGMNTTPEAEREDFKAASQAIDELRVKQVEELVRLSSAVGQAAYRQLIQLHPDHPKRSEWVKRLEDLEDSG